MKKYPLIKPKIDVELLIKHLKKIAQSGILTKGEFVHTFEADLGKFLKSKYCYTTTSATTALHLSLVAAGVKAGDEVLVSDYSFPASGNVICQVGAKPVFVDIDLQTFNINLEDLKAKITPKTKAIEVVHAFGYPANMSEIMKIAKKYHLFVIEDAACAIGSKHQGKYCGTWGDLGCFSFHPRKVITTGEGGAVATNNSELAKKIEIYRNHGGIKTKKGWEFIEAGFNYRMSELQAALGIDQLKNLNRMISIRQKIAQKYIRALKNQREIGLPRLPLDGDFNFQTFVILLPKRINRDTLVERLSRKGIETTIGTYAQHAQKAFSRFGYKPGQLKNSFYAYKSALSLPLSDDMGDKDIKYVTGFLKKFTS